MTNEQEMKEIIQSTVRNMMEELMNKVLIKDPFIKEIHRAKKPLYAALVPDEIFRSSHFERRFVTPFGRIWEKLAVIAAQQGLGYGVQGRNIVGTVKAERLRRITEVINSLEHPQPGQPRKKPNWEAELEYVLGGDGNEIPASVTCDVYVKNTLNNQRFAFEIKAPLPNSDQTKVSKEKILKLYSMEPLQIDGAYYALPYNPYGRRENYNWSFPGRWFNMREDEVVLIGEDFWEKIGGIGTYQAFVDAINEIGHGYRERIYREFLEVEPPSNGDEVRL